MSRHAKINGIDADTLARLPLVDPAGLHPLELPGAQAAALDRRVRVTDRLTVLAARHKTRIKDLTRQLLPCSPAAPPVTKRQAAKSAERARRELPAPRDRDQRVGDRSAAGDRRSGEGHGWLLASGSRCLFTYTDTEHRFGTPEIFMGLADRPRVDETCCAVR